MVSERDWTQCQHPLVAGNVKRTLHVCFHFCMSSTETETAFLGASATGALQPGAEQRSKGVALSPTTPSPRGHRCGVCTVPAVALWPGADGHMSRTTATAVDNEGLTQATSSSFPKYWKLAHRQYMCKLCASNPIGS